MEAIDKLLKDLDEVARNYDPYEYGLPIEDEGTEMRNLVTEFLKAKSGNVGKVITDFFCNGWFGRRYDLEGAVIEAEGKDWILIRIKADDDECGNLHMLVIYYQNTLSEDHRKFQSPEFQ